MKYYLEHMLGQLKLVIKACALVAILSFVVITHLWPERDTLGSVSLSVTTTAAVISVSYMLFKVGVWRIVARVKGVPIIHGRHDATIEFKHSTTPSKIPGCPPAEGKVVRKPAQVVIEQCYRDFHMVLSTEQINSKTFVGKIQGSGIEAEIIYMYRTEVNQGRFAQYPMQTGACVLVKNTSYECYVGRYWTDQLTHGTIYFDKVSSVAQHARSLESGISVDGEGQVG